MCEILNFNIKSVKVQKWRKSRVIKEKIGCSSFCFFPAAMTTFHVYVYTGDKFGAGTDANVYVILHGEHDDTGRYIDQVKNTWIFILKRNGIFTCEETPLFILDIIMHFLFQAKCS